MTTAAPWGPPARQLVTAAEGLTQTAVSLRPHWSPGTGPEIRAEIAGRPAMELLPFAGPHPRAGGPSR